jgi:hypothetical protein
VASGHPERRGAERARREDELAGAKLQHTGPDDPDEHRHAADPDGDHRVLETRPERGDDGQRQEEPGERQHHVHEPADRQVHLAAAEPRGEPGAVPTTPPMGR